MGTSALHRNAGDQKCSTLASFAVMPFFRPGGELAVPCHPPKYSLVFHASMIAREPPPCPPGRTLSRRDCVADETTSGFDFAHGERAVVFCRTAQSSQRHKTGSRINLPSHKIERQGPNARVLNSLDPRSANTDHCAQHVCCNPCT